MYKSNQIDIFLDEHEIKRNYTLLDSSKVVFPLPPMETTTMVGGHYHPLDLIEINLAIFNRNHLANSK